MKKINLYPVVIGAGFSILIIYAVGERPGKFVLLFFAACVVLWAVNELFRRTYKRCLRKTASAYHVHLQVPLYSNQFKKVNCHCCHEKGFQTLVTLERNENRKYTPEHVQVCIPCYQRICRLWHRMGRGNHGQ